MKNLIVKSPSDLFNTIFIPFLVSILLFILLLSTLLYLNFEKIASDIVYNHMVTDLQNISRSADMMKQTAKTLSVEAFFDSEMSDMLYSDINQVQYGKYIRKLGIYKNINPFLQSVYVYNGHHFYVSPSLEFVYDSTFFQDREIVNMLNNMQTYKSNTIVSRVIPNPTMKQLTGKDGPLFVYTYFFYDSQLLSGKISEAIILNISEEWLRDTIKSMSNNMGNRILIIDKQGVLMANDTRYPMLADISHEKYIRDLLASNKSIGYLRAEVDGIDSFVTYVSSDIMDWRFISVMPYKEIVRKITDMRLKTYICALLALIAGIIASYYLSRRLYIPVKALLTNYNLLMTEKRKESYKRRQEFLKNLVFNSASTDVHTISSEFARNNVPLEPSLGLLPMLARLDRFADFCLTYNNDDRSLMKFAAINIISEVLSEKYRNECIDIGEDHVLILINYEESLLPSQNESLTHLLQQIQAHTGQYLKLSLSIAIGQKFDSVRQLNHAYGSVLELSFFRIASGYESLIYHEKTNILDSSAYKYPFEKEKLLVNELMLGHNSEAGSILSDILADTFRYGQAAFTSTLLRLLLSVNNVIETIRMNCAITVEYNFDTYLANLRKLETLKDILDIFFVLFRDLSEALAQNMNKRHDNVIEAAIGVISSEYHNVNLSLESVADAVDLSPAYLGKLFKKHKLCSVSDYINMVRISSAKKLLLTSRQPVDMIMENTGFLSRSHFYTQFKKVYGVTPSQFRQNHASGMSGS